MRQLLYVFVTILLTSALAIAGQQDAYLGFDAEMESMGISTTSYNSHCHRILNEVIQSRSQRAQEKADSGDKDAKKEVKALDFASALLDAAVDGSLRQRFQAYRIALRTLYAIKAQEVVDMEAAGESPRGAGAGGISGVLAKIKQGTQRIPYVSDAAFDRPIGLEAAQKEAKNLAWDEDSANFLTPEQLARLTHREISELQVPDNHPAWMNDDAYDPDRYEKLVKWANKRTTKGLKKKKAKGMTEADAAAVKADPFKYDMAASDGVLIVSKVKNTATSAKISTKDAYGVGRKLKWTTEIHTEPIANRLYVAAGSKFADLCNIHGPGLDGVVLVLGAPGEGLSTVDELQAGLTESYDFNIRTYILDEGEITAENVDEILAKMPQDDFTKVKKSDLIGRVYITFKESMTEFKGKFGLNRLGPTPMSQAFAMDDRIQRNLMVFNHLIHNADAKDDNNRCVLAKDLDEKGDCFYEFHHDLGVSLGKPSEKGNPNGLELGRGFTRLNLNRTKILIDQWTLYRPAAWGNITYADARAAMEDIMRIDNKSLEEIFRASHMPDFWVQAQIDKFKARRNQMAALFRVNVPAEQQFAPSSQSNIAVDLSSRRARNKAERHYGLPLGSISKEMVDVGLLDFEVQQIDFKDFLYDGQSMTIAECNNTVLLGLLVEHRYPSGIVRRHMPKFDNVALPRCRYGMRKPPSMGLGDSVGRWLTKWVPFLN